MWHASCPMGLMCMRRIVLFFIGFSLLQTAVATSVTVAGVAPEFPGKQLFLYTYSNAFTNELIELGNCSISDSGTFSVTAELDQTREILLRIGWVSAKMLASPGAAYQVELNIGSSGQVRAFHQSAFIDPQFIDLNPADPNYQVSRFNERYEAFFANHYIEIAQATIPSGTAFKRANEERLKDLIVKGDSAQTQSFVQGRSFKALLDSFRSEWLSEAGKATDVFVADYIRFAIASLDLAVGVPRKQLHENYLTAESIPLINPEFARFATEFYAQLNRDWMASRMSREAITRAFQSAEPADSLMLILGETGLCGTEPLLLLASSLSTYALKDHPDINIASTRLVLNQLAAIETRSGFSLAEAFLKQMNATQIGSKVPELRLLGTNGERAELADLSGKFIYIVATASWCVSCREELKLLEKISPKYARDIEVVVLSLDEDFQDFKNLVAGNHRNKWTFLYGMSEPLIREKLNLWALPGYIMIDPNGNWYLPNAQAPSAGAENRFLKIQNELHQPGKLKVWDD